MMCELRRQFRSRRVSSPLPEPRSGALRFLRLHYLRDRTRPPGYTRRPKKKGEVRFLTCRDAYYSTGRLAQTDELLRRVEDALRQTIRNTKV